MAKRISATKAVRDFSELLNRIRFKGDHYIIERSGKPVALMEPIKDVKHAGTLKEIKFLLKELPPLDDELEAFAEDLEDIWKAQPPFPEESTWE
jgi:antitoxin (DNA-binding transcriptional repressor) of toxin-antitoxin stability system